MKSLIKSPDLRLFYQYLLSPNYQITELKCTNQGNVTMISVEGTRDNKHPIFDLLLLDGNPVQNRNQHYIKKLAATVKKQAKPT